MNKLMLIALHTVLHDGKHVPEGKPLHVTLEQAEVLVRCNAARPATDDEQRALAPPVAAPVAPAVVPEPAAPPVAAEPPAPSPPPQDDGPVVTVVTDTPVADDVAVTKKKAKS